MASPVTSVAGFETAILECLSSGDSSTTIDKEYSYQISHNGVDETGTADTNVIIISVAATVTATLAGSTNKFAITAGGAPVYIGPYPKLTTITYRSPAGHPTMSLCRSASYLGRA